MTAFSAQRELIGWLRSPHVESTITLFDIATAPFDSFLGA
jgi:hypothetical protein